MRDRFIVRAATMAVACALLFVSAVRADSVTWEAFEIRQASGGTTTPIGATGASDGSYFTALIDQSGEKAGYGTSHFDGQHLSTVGGVSYTRLDAGSRYPYVNIWITNGTNYAVIAPGQVTTGGGVLTSNVNGLDIQSLGLTIYETNFADLSWLGVTGAYRHAGQALLHADDTPVLISELGHLFVGDPGVYPSPPVGTGAPKNGNGFQLVFGDTQSSFNQAVPYEIGNVTVTSNGSVQVVPVPAAAPLGLALFGLIGVKRYFRSRTEE